MIYITLAYSPLEGQRLPNKMFLFGITVLAVVIIVGGLSWTLFNNNNQLLPSENSQPDGASPVPGDQNPEATPSDTNPESTSPSTTPPSDGTEIPNPSSSPTIISQEQIRDITMSAVKAKYPEIAALMVNLNWTGGRSEAGSPDNETYLYYSPGWTVTVENPLTSEPIYTITGNYNSETMFIAFTAVYKNGALNITSYRS